MKVERENGHQPSHAIIHFSFNREKLKNSEKNVDVAINIGKTIALAIKPMLRMALAW